MQVPMPDEDRVNGGLPVAATATSDADAVYFSVPISSDTPAAPQQSAVSQSRRRESDQVIVIADGGSGQVSNGGTGSAKQGSEGGHGRVVSGAGTRVALGVQKGQGSVGEVRHAVKVNKSKENVSEDVMNSRILEFGLRPVIVD